MTIATTIMLMPAAAALAPSLELPPGFDVNLTYSGVPSSF
jgi:hypothetical protein